MASFENIFEKFNIKRKVIKKRHRSSKEQRNISHMNKLPILTKIEAENSMICCNSNAEKSSNINFYRYLNNTNSKYKIPIRYKRLEIISVNSIAKRENFNSSTDFLHSPNFNISSGKENEPELSSLGKKELNNQTNWFNGSDFGKSSGTKNYEVFSTQTANNCPTELDLLIDLIEQDEKNSKTYQLIADNRTEKSFNCDDRLLITKPRLKGGYEEMFERSLKHEKSKSNFLKYDKKFGLRVGQLLTIVKIETFHGLTLATVNSQDINKNFVVIVAREMAQHLVLGAEIEAFFDEKTFPYKLLLDGEYIDVYLEPYKLVHK